MMKVFEINMEHNRERMVSLIEKYNHYGEERGI